MNHENTSPQVASVTSSRRRWLYVSAAALAGMGGAGFALLRYTPDQSDASTEAARNFWNLSFETPVGATLPMGPFKGRPLLINFWATWCPPCIEELPLLDAFFKQNASKGWQVLGIAVDKPASVRDFLARKPLTFPVAMAGLAGADLSKSFGNSGGGLPFTLVMDSNGAVAKRKIGKLSEADLASWQGIR